MATELLPAGTLGSVTGKWVRSATGGKKTLPARVSVAGNYAGDGVFIEHLVGGVPGNGSKSPYPPANDTGTVMPLGVVPEGGGDLAIHEPVEYIRARTGAFTGGTVTFAGILYDA